MKHVCRVLLCLPLGALLLGCTDRNREPEPIPEEESAASPKLTAFSCDCEGNRVVVKFEKEGREAWMFLPGQTVRLPQVAAASGTKYSDGEITLWSKGREATVELSDGGRWNCQENRRASVIEDAKFRGVAFWAVGNEPGWILEIDPETTVFLTDYGQDRYVFPTPEPAEDQESRTTTYVTEHAGHMLTVQITGQPCQDSMSDESFESTVELTLDDRTYPGCGQSLH